jgi:hypothetical protein
VIAVFTVHCPNHRAEVLLGTRSITAVRNHRKGVEVDWRCRCGATGTLRFGGRRAAATDVPSSPPAALPVPDPVPELVPTPGAGVPGIVPATSAPAAA